MGLRDSPEYTKWRRAVIKRDGGKCQMCGAKRTLQVHHLERWADNPALRYNVANGITLCKRCHKSIFNKEDLVRGHLQSVLYLEGGLNVKRALREMAKKPKYKVIIDTREQQPYSFEPSDTCEGFCVEKLDEGDYSIEGYKGILAVERKRNTSEWAQNIIDPRFERELIRLEGLKWSFCLLEFSLDDILSFPVNSGIPEYKWSKIKITPSFILKKTIEFQTKYKTKFILCGSRGNAFQTLTAIFKGIIRGEVESKDNE